VMANASDLLCSPPAVAREALSHRYLVKVVALSEGVAAAWFHEDPGRREEMVRLLVEFEDTFRDGYDPVRFIQELPSLRRLDPRLKESLQEIVGREYLERFRPEDRLATCRTAAAALRETFEAWFGQVSSSGRDPTSAVQWKGFIERAGELRTLLSDPELRCRWIP